MRAVAAWSKAGGARSLDSGMSFGLSRGRQLETKGPNGERVMSVELTKGTLTRTTNFFLVQGRERWYVRSADIEPVRDLCSDRKK